MNEKRERGLEMMREVYGWEMPDLPGEFFAQTVDHLFAEIWTRPGLTLRDRRLLLLGAIAAQGLDDIAAIQVKAALRNEEMDAEQLREAVVFLTHYVGWPLGSKLSMTVDKAIAKHEKKDS
ncbi:carboxymuconolactone decarboxylase family protein [Actinophytocola sp.]|uniref:carboxymuconolactone decarboxylase family protein n=1 Tax=Actinophytocola sp. TaxID=1872138 RepID=UPI002D6F1A02|nr:carboxymuconolactone decarboxylase family protein [Actinophytocola sp.]HYQ66976.1 carboxymuconolactone decarboxylase family protein [Actinophytocola sp.]